MRRSLIAPSTLKQVFIVPANGPEAFQHYQETIARKRTLAEIQRFLPADDLNILRGMYHEAPFVVWGATAGRGNARTFQQMNYGDYILFSQRGQIVLIGEIAWKLTNRELARYFWRTNVTGETWEHIYFIINQRDIHIPAEQLWRYLDYEPHFRLQGLMQVEQNRVRAIEETYGGFYDVLVRLDGGQKLQERLFEPGAESTRRPALEEEPRTREHDEIQWRLIRLGRAANVDVWVPKNDQGREWDGHRFRDFVLPEFREGLDIPRTVENIDTVWRFGYRIRAAFEIEHSTAIYSGLLRLSDLKTIAPNSLYPMYIAAPSDRRDKVLGELSRPTFHDQLKLHEVARYLSYEKIRELDEQYGSKTSGLRPEMLEEISEQVS
jgi:hypothetical protein